MFICWRDDSRGEGGGPTGTPMKVTLDSGWAGEGSLGKGAMVEGGGEEGREIVEGRGGGSLGKGGDGEGGRGG